MLDLSYISFYHVLSNFLKKNDFLQDNDDGTITDHVILLNLRQQLDDDDGQRNLVNVVRRAVLNGAERAFQKSTFNAKLPLNVNFIGEAGIDAGGPTHEFMTLCLQKITESPTLRVTPRRLLLTSNISG